MRIPYVLPLALAFSALVKPVEGQNATVLFACYAPETGTVYRIREPGLPQECETKNNPKHNHTMFSWNAPGPRGPRGEAGVAGAAGAQGQPGPTGLPGDAGAIGPAGMLGAAGTAGLIGPRGPDGPAGAAGETGAPGARGIAGPVGTAGDAGAAGLMGDAGPVGAAGPQGVIGPVGAVGPVGPQGQSIPGAAGAPGAPGDVGPEGPQGPTVPGPQGPRGDAGKSGITIAHNLNGAPFTEITNSGATLQTLTLEPGKYMLYAGVTLQFGYWLVGVSNSGYCTLTRGLPLLFRVNERQNSSLMLANYVDLSAGGGTVSLSCTAGDVNSRPTALSSWLQVLRVQ